MPFVRGDWSTEVLLRGDRCRYPYRKGEGAKIRLTREGGEPRLTGGLGQRGVALRDVRGGQSPTRGVRGMLFAISKD